MVFRLTWLACLLLDAALSPIPLHLDHEIGHMWLGCVHTRDAPTRKSLRFGLRDRSNHQAVYGIIVNFRGKCFQVTEIWIALKKLDLELVLSKFGMIAWKGLRNSYVYLPGCCFKCLHDKHKFISFACWNLRKLYLSGHIAQRHSEPGLAYLEVRQMISWNDCAKNLDCWVEPPRIALNGPGFLLSLHW